MNFKQLTSGLLATLIALAFISPVAHADVNDFAINALVVDYTLGLDDPQGTLTVHEQFTVEFTDNNHGILRALPEKYNGLPQHLDIKSVSLDGESEKYTTYNSNGNTVLKIGDADKTVTGLHHYDIKYKVTNVMRILADGKAELDWNVNGTEWGQPFRTVSAKLHVPDTLKDKLSNERCFTGSTGSSDSNCLPGPTSTGNIFSTTQELQPGQTLTFNVTVPAGYFTKPSLADRWDDYGLQVILALGLPLLALGIAGNTWHRRGRDAKGRGTIVPEYGPPSALKPAEIDVILHNKLGKNAVSATIIDLAIRKYLRIQETESKGVLGIGKHSNYSFVKLPSPNGQLNDYESEILAGLFATGDAVEMDSLKNTFHTTLSSVQKSIPKSLATRGYFAGNPAHAGIGWQVVGGLLIFGSFYLLQFGVWLLVSAILAGLILMIFGFLMPKRTPLGAAAKDASEGLKLYLDTAEKDRIAMLQSPDAPYAPQTAEPVKTVELFERLLPFAMILGVEQKWAQQFQNIYTSPPDWYGGNWSTFSAIALADSLNGSVGAMNSSFAAPSSSGSGSGGSAGGGGGGGGGGGW